MKKNFITVVLVGIIVFQFYPIKRNSIFSETAIKSDKQVVDIFKRACYDCHSYETVWPFYTNIFPVSAITAYEVEEGRKELNFSTWEELTPLQKSIKAETIQEKVLDKTMPPKSYLLFHRNSKLSNVDIEIIKRWVKRTQREESLRYNE